MELVFQRVPAPCERGSCPVVDKDCHENDHPHDSDTYECAIDAFRIFLVDQLQLLQAQFLARHRQGSKEPRSKTLGAQMLHLPETLSSRMPAPGEQSMGMRSLMSSGSHSKCSSCTPCSSKSKKNGATNELSVKPRIASSGDDAFNSSPRMLERDVSFDDSSRMLQPMKQLNSVDTLKGVGSLGSCGTVPMTPVGANLALLPCWKDSLDKTAASRPTKVAGRETSTGDSAEGDRWGDLQQSQTPLRRCIMHPDSSKRMVWILVSCLLIAYDVFTIPLLAFDMLDGRAVRVITWCSTLWWTADIFVTFFVGYHKEGIIEMRPVEIARRFLRTWFLVDLTVVLLDCLLSVTSYLVEKEQIGTNSAGLLRWGKMLRFSRMVRLLRLVRLYKVTRALRILVDSIHSEYWIVLLNIFKLIFLIVVLNHYVACVWYAIAYFNEEDPITWASFHGVEGEDNSYKYLVSLHWSLTQFTPATNDIGPKNLRERLFAVMVVLFAMVVFSSFVSSITARMTQLRTLNKDRLLEEAKIREYLGKKRVSLNLGHRIWGFLRKHYRPKHKLLHEKDIVFFLELPAALKKELKTEIYLPTLLTHLAFSYVVEINMEAATAICSTLMNETTFRPGQDVFVEGEEAGIAIYVVSGSFTYYHNHELTKGEHSTWLSEICLWCKWCYVGSTQAETAMQLVSLSSAKLGDVMMQRSPDRIRSLKFVTNYAKLFFAAAAASAKRCLYLSDLPIDQHTLIRIADAAYYELEGKVLQRMDRRRFDSKCSSTQGSVFKKSIASGGVFGRWLRRTTVGGLGQPPVDDDFSDVDVGLLNDRAIAAALKA